MAQTDQRMKAVELFRNGYNCAQSVLMPFSDHLKADPVILEKISLAFGGGMGRLQKTCGAMTGAFMVLSLHIANTIEDDELRQDRLRELIQAFHLHFTSLHGKSDCKELLAYDLNTETGRDHILDKGLKERICVPCVESAVNILNNMLNL